MNKEIIVGLSIPQEWIDKLSELSKSTGRPLNDLLREAIAEYIAAKTNNSALLELKTQLTILQQKIALLESDRGQVKKLGLRLEIIESQLAKGVFTQENLSNDNNLIDDNIDDEPDEILLDFLPHSSS